MQTCFPWPHKLDATTKRDVVAVSSDTPWGALGSAPTFVTKVRSRYAHGVAAVGELSGVDIYVQWRGVAFEL
jgi:hypothetical protein